MPLAAQLLERDAELRVVDAAIADAVAGRGRVVILKGEAGIGKSSLVRAAVERARACGLTVLEARGAELERNYPYGAVLDLLGPRVHASEGSLSGPAALAAPIFEAPGSGSADTLALLHGLYWMVLGMTDETPLLIALDDAHWADDASIRFVEYLAQRVGDLRVCLLVAMRPLDEASVESAPRELLSSLQSVSGAGHLEPQRLSTEAVGTMVERHGLADPYGWLRRSAWQATGGNPFMLTELLRTGDAELIRTVGAERWQAGGIPAAISRVIVARLRSAGAGARSLAEAVAVLGDDADLAHAAALAGMTQDEAVAAARRLVEHALFDPGSSLRFIHPIARSAVYGRIPEAVRARDHRRAAALLTESGAPPESVAPHLLRVDPAADQGNVAVLRGAAAAAMRRGDPRSAGALLERAVAEPPREEARVAVLVELAQAQAAVGAEAAVGSYTQALRLSRDPRERAAIRLGLGNALISAARWVDAVEAFERGMREVRADDPLATQLEAGFVSAAWVGMVRREEVEGRLGRILRAERLEPAQRELATFAAFRSSIEVTGSAAEAMRLVDRALAGMSIDEAVRTGQIVEVAAGVLVTTDQLDREIRLLTDAIDAVQRAGSQAKFGVYSYCRAWPLYFSGRLAEAIADTEQALRAAELGWEVFLPAACAVMSQALLERGEIDSAARVLELDPERWSNRVDFEVLIPIARGRVHLARNELEAAHAQFRVADAAGQATGVRGVVLPEWRSWSAVTLARMGRRDEAVTVASEAVELAERWGTRWAIGVALRALGVAQGAERGLDTLARSVAELDPGPARLELARALWAHGAALRRAGHLADARPQLMRAMELAHALGAVDIQERARAELVAAGSRPRRYAFHGSQALTPSELRVARMAAAGRTNREIAQALFVTPKAIEYHLANAYRKLGITSRRDLPDAVNGDRRDERAS